MSRLIDEARAGRRLIPLTAARSPIRPQHDRFLVTTHEAPDGDALGSLLATKLALDQLGKDVVMYLTGEVPLPREYGFMPLDELVRERPPPTRPSACCVAVDCAKEARLAGDEALSGWRRSSSTSTITTTTRASATST